MADCSGVPFRRLLRSDDFLRDFATLAGLLDLNTFDFRSNASLFSVTFADHFFFFAGLLLLFFPVAFRLFFRIDFV